MAQQDQARSDLSEGRAVLGIELGSTRIKATLIGSDLTPIASGSHSWENTLVDGLWSYSLQAVWSGLQECYADLLADVRTRYGVTPHTYAAMGVSAMMHGYLAFDAEATLLVPFRTWRNTNTAEAAARLTDLFRFNIPLRWSVAHLYQAVLDDEPHLPRLHSITTLAGYVHWQLTGRQVLGIGDAAGMFPVDPRTHTWDSTLLDRFEDLTGGRVPVRLADALPEVLVAGADAGRLTPEGAALLDPTGTLEPGVPLCPPEGDAGTGMVATGAVAPRTGNVSVGTSIFAMIVLDRPLAEVHPEIDLVATPAGDTVAMVHCNNGASELGEWASVFGRFAEALGAPASSDRVFEVLLSEAMSGAADGGGLVAYNCLAGEPVLGLDAGRPLLLRTPDSSLSLANVIRVQVDAAFAALSLGMRILAADGIGVDSMFAHGGLFRTPGPAQRLLAAALNTPVTVGGAAGEGGPWGMALLAAYRGEDEPLPQFLAHRVFSGAASERVDPDPADVAGFASYLERFEAGLAAERAAAAVN